ncbi:unnamed protein product [Mytilus edulis]|uniref:Ig-like domain-containing protein n=1 Tax=Mytilus edulis TaxID=6550 RepID=A0A8S3V2G9_MYTED|nr:unnamed protein product [Mytilus edulis]
MTYVYVYENVTVVLSCNYNVAAWWGPIPLNLTTYVSGGKLDPKLPHYTRLSFDYNHTANTAELHIHKFTKEDEGLYRCSYTENDKYQMKEETVLIRILPIVQILEGNSISVVEGSSVDLRCNYNSNHVINDIKWQHDNKNIINSSQLHLESIKRDQTGEYYCTVSNQAGSVTANVTIELLYPPDVAVSFSDKDEIRQLKCDADGFPKSITLEIGNTNLNSENISDSYLQQKME